MTIAEVIDNLAEGRADDIRDGFRALAKMKPEYRTEAFRLLSTAMETAASNIDLEPLGETSGLSSRTIRSAIDAISGIVNISTEGEFRLDDFVAAGRGKLFDEEHEAIAKVIIGEVLASPQNWALSHSRRRLAVETLPAFLSLDTSVDLRFRFTKGKITDATPVLVLHLDTDTEGKEVWFQATRGDVQLMLDQLNKAARQLEHVDQFYSQQGSSRQA